MAGAARTLARGRAALACRISPAACRAAAPRAWLAGATLEDSAARTGQCATYFSRDKSKSPYEYGAHRSNAEEMIDQVPVVEVDGEVALCDGGGGALGHPLEYVQLFRKGDEPAECKYCGVRFKMKKHH